jgi:endoglucanase
MKLGWSPRFNLSFAVGDWNKLKLGFELLVALAVFSPALAAEFTPANPAEMVALKSKNSPAHQAIQHFRRGANLGNYLEAPKGQSWGVRYSQADFEHIKAEGFDHVRLPVRWNDYAGPAPDFKLTDEIYGKADFLVTNALAHGLSVIVNIHHFDEFTTDPAAQTDKFLALWKQIAAHYAKSPSAVAFELLNEPKDNAKTLVLNPIYARAIKIIRETNPKRAIFVGPGKWNSVDELKDLVLPADDNNLIVTVHCYDPFLFTHQGATWAGKQTRTKGLVFPGPPAAPLSPDPEAVKSAGYLSNWFKNYNIKPTVENPVSAKPIEEKMKRAHDWGAYYGRPIHVGEFGCYIAADADSRKNFHTAYRRILDKYDLAWALWDWKAGFRYWDDKANAPAPGMREALFGKK